VLPFSLFLLGLLERARPQVVEAVPGAVEPVGEVPTPGGPVRMTVREALWPPPTEAGP
jgi:hypothetical protein